MYAYNEQQSAKVDSYDEGLRSYMIGVYNQMTAALVLSGVVAYLSAPLIEPLMNTLWIFAIALLPLAFVFVLTFGMHKLSVSAARLVFYSYAFTMGLSLSTIFITFTSSSIAKVFFITAATFASASLYGYTTKRDLSSMGSFLFMGVIGLLIASVVNVFLASSMMSWIISVVGVLVFTAMTAYDSQELKNEYLSGGEVYGFDSQEKSSIFGALMLYMNFVIIFQHLMNLLGEKEE